jgi:hypothetical protein
MNEKSEFPYLVDIGLGNLCYLAGNKCKIPCYASAHKKGRMADSYFIKNALKTLFQSNVFEINFGGLEPTLYHGSGGETILSILRESKEFGFRTAITTRNYEWYKIQDFKAHLQNIDSVAISCNTKNDIDEADVLRKQILDSGTNVDFRHIYIQNILGLHPYEQLVDFLEYAKSKGFYYITLLGYKEFGFGAKQQPYDISEDWIEFIKLLDINIGVDSVIVQKWRDQLVKHGINYKCLVGEEGKQTCYLDGLTESLAASSFTDKQYKLSKNFEKKEFLEIYAKF